MCVIINDVVNSFNNAENNGKNYVVTKIRKTSFDFSAKNDKREETVKYTIYLKENKLYLRRYTLTGMFFKQVTGYQMFKNSKTKEWKSFSTCEELINELNKYILKTNKSE